MAGPPTTERSMTPSALTMTGYLALGLGTALLGAVVWVALSVPGAHGYDSGTAAVILGVGVVWGIVHAVLAHRRVGASLRWAAAGKRKQPADDQQDPRIDRVLAEAGATVLAAIAASLGALALGGQNWWSEGGLLPLALPVLWVCAVWVRMALYRKADARFNDEETSLFLVLSGCVYVVAGALFAVLPSLTVLVVIIGTSLSYCGIGTAALRARDADARRLRRELAAATTTEERADALERFARNVSPDGVSAHADLIATQVEAVAMHQPGRALGLLAQAPSLAEPEVVRRAVRAWAAEPEGTDFERAWEALGAVTGGGTAAVHARLLAILTTPDRADVAEGFRARAVRKVFDAVDAEPEHHPCPEAAAWSLLDLLRSNSGPKDLGEWWCALGDAAADAGKEEQAQQRYRRADAEGCELARPRLANHLARAGHRALTGGDFATARSLLAEAVQLADSLDYRLLLELTRADTPAEPPSAHELAGWRAEAWYAAALLHLRRGETRPCRELMRVALVRMEAADAPEGLTGLAATARLILAVLDRDASAVASAARALYERHGDSWAEHTPFTPATVLTRIAAEAHASDPALLAALLSALGPQESPEDAATLAELRRVAAHRELRTAAEAADAQRHAEAVRGVDRVLCLLDRPAATGRG